MTHTWQVSRDIQPYSIGVRFRSQAPNGNFQLTHKIKHSAFFAPLSYSISPLLSITVNPVDSQLEPVQENVLLNFQFHFTLYAVVLSQTILQSQFGKVCCDNKLSSSSVYQNIKKNFPGQLTTPHYCTTKIKLCNIAPVVMYNFLMYFSGPDYPGQSSWAQFIFISKW